LNEVSPDSAIYLFLLFMTFIPFRRIKSINRDIYKYISIYGYYVSHLSSREGNTAHGKPYGKNRSPCKCPGAHLCAAGLLQGSLEVEPAVSNARLPARGGGFLAKPPAGLALAFLVTPGFLF